jgi:hypothetical protein
VFSEVPPQTGVAACAGAAPQPPDDVATSSPVPNSGFEDLAPCCLLEKDIHEIFEHA